MPLYIETLNDQLIEDECPKLSDGVNSFSPVDSIGTNQLAKLVNADVSVEGRVITRRGSAVAATAWSYPLLGMAYWKTEVAGTYQSNLVAVVRDASAFGRFKIWDGSNWQNPPVNADMSPTLPVMMVQGENLMWIAQEGFFLQYFNGTGLVTASHGGATTAPDKPSLIVWHTGRLIAAGIPGDPEGLQMSKYFDGTIWDHTNWDIGVGDGDGDPIVGLISWTNFNLVVLKKHSVWMVDCDPSLVAAGTGNIAGFRVTNVHRMIGTLCGRSAAQVGDDVFFLSDSGVRSIARTLASDQQKTVGEPISEPISDIINRINPAAVSTIVGYSWKKRYMLCLPLDSATYPNYTVVWNTQTKCWSGYWTGWQPTCFTRRLHSSITKLCFGQSTGAVTDFLDYVDEDSEVESTYQDQGVDYATEIVSRAFSLGNRNALKTGSHAPLEFNKSSATITASVILNSSDDDIDISTFSTESGIVSLPVDLPFDLAAGGIYFKALPLRHLGQWRHLQLKLASAAGKISLNRFGVAGWMDTHKVSS